MAPSQRQNPYLPQLDKKLTPAEQRHSSTASIEPLHAFSMHWEGRSVWIIFLALCGVIEGISTVTEGWGESCVSYKFLHDTAGLGEEDRMSEVQYLLLTRNQCGSYVL